MNGFTIDIKNSIVNIQLKIELWYNQLKIEIQTKDNPNCELVTLRFSFIKLRVIR